MFGLKGSEFEVVACLAGIVAAKPLAGNRRPKGTSAAARIPLVVTSLDAPAAAGHDINWHAVVACVMLGKKGRK